MTTLYTDGSTKGASLRGGQDGGVEDFYSVQKASDVNGGVSITNGKTTVQMSDHGLIDSIDTQGKGMDLKQRFSLYRTKRSGAYLFRPEGAMVDLPATPPHFRVTKGACVRVCAVFVLFVCALHLLIYPTSVFCLILLLLYRYSVRNCGGKRARIRCVISRRQVKR